MTFSRRDWILRSAAPPLLSILPSACGALGGTDEPNPKQPLLLEISITADVDANIDTHERGAPILLRIYELASDVRFLEADFFSIQDREKITLGSDLLSTDVFMLRPGDTRSIRRKAQAGTTAIGVFAAYRDLPAAVWRTSHALAPAVDAHWYRKAAKLRLGISVQARGLLLKDADAMPDPAPANRARESAVLPATPMTSMTSMPPKTPMTQLADSPAMPALPAISNLPQLPSVPDLKP